MLLQFSTKHASETLLEVLVPVVVRPCSDTQITMICIPMPFLAAFVAVHRLHTASARSQFCFPHLRAIRTSHGAHFTLQRSPLLFALLLHKIGCDVLSIARETYHLHFPQRLQRHSVLAIQRTRLAQIPQIQREGK